MKDDGRIPRIKDTDMTDRLLTAGAIAEDTRNPIGDIAACFPCLLYTSDAADE